MEDDERFVRDLIWAINSPLLMDLTGQLPAWTRPLNANDIDREHLSIYLNSPAERRVGPYFERLVTYWIEFIRRCEIVAHSLQVRDAKRTVGEIDLVFRDEQGRLNHWELACKFYLQADVGDPPRTEYIGPNANDTLQKKATRLLEHQLPLGTRHFPKIEFQRAIVKGRIFYHWQSDPKVSLPTELAASHQQGKWLWAQEATAMLSGKHRSYRILRKPFWLAEELAKQTDDDLMTNTEMKEFIEDHFGRRQTPILFSEFSNSASPVIESGRWFVVRDQWPH